MLFSCNAHNSCLTIKNLEKIGVLVSAPSIITWVISVTHSITYIQTIGF